MRGKLFAEFPCDACKPHAIPRPEEFQTRRTFRERGEFWIQLPETARAPLRFHLRSPAATVQRQPAARSQTAPHWDGFKYGRDLISAVIVSTGTFTVVWMIAMITAIFFLNRG